MGMPVTIVIAEENVKEEDIIKAFTYLHHIDDVFSLYKKNSEMSKINRKEIHEEDISKEVKKVFNLAEKTKHQTNGYFDITQQNGKKDPSGIVKGYAIHQCAVLLKRKYKNFFIEIAGDIELVGLNNSAKWKVGIENPFNRKEIIKVLFLSNKGVATSGTYIRGLHIYNPVTQKKADTIASVTVVGENAYEADRFATAIFAMGENGINFLEKQKNLEGYIVKKNKSAIMTKGFEKYTHV